MIRCIVLWMSYMGAQSFLMPQTRSYLGDKPAISTADSFSTSLKAGLLSSVTPVVTSVVSTTLTLAKDLTKVVWKDFYALNTSQKALFVAIFFLGFFCGKLRPFWKRFQDTMQIPGQYFGAQAPILSGQAVSVSDGDTFRLLHTPYFASPKKLSKKEKLSETTLPIRIATIDTPETSKFGNPGQPFGQEAKEFLEKLISNKKVKVKLLQKDQYGRAVAEVYVRGLFRRKYVDEMMLKAGLAEVYRGGGAVYGRLGLDAYNELELAAQNAKKGIWSQKNRESAADYKRRTK